MSQRTEILAREGLAAAPQAEQESFWRNYNQRRSRRRPPATLGDLVAKACPDLPKANRPVDRKVESAWLRVLPAEYADATRVEGFQGGRLRVRVNGAAVRFVLERQLGPVLLQAVNIELGSPMVSRIEFRLSPTKEPSRRVWAGEKKRRGTKE